MLARLQAQVKKMMSQYRFENHSVVAFSPAPTSQDSAFPTAHCLALISHLSNYESREVISRGQIEVSLFLSQEHLSFHSFQKLRSTEA